MQQWTIWDWLGVIGIPLLVGAVIWYAINRNVMTADEFEQLRQRAVRRLERVRRACEAIGPGLEGHVSTVMRELCPKSKAEWSKEATVTNGPEPWMRGLTRLNSNKLGIRLLRREDWKLQRHTRIAFAEARDEHAWVPVYYDTELAVIVDSTLVSERPSDEMLTLSPRTTTEWIAIHLEHRFGKRWRKPGAAETV